MRIIFGIIVGIFGGFILGIALSSFIGMVGMMVFDQPMGIKYLPYFTSIICAVLVPIIENRAQRVKSN